MKLSLHGSLYLAAALAGLFVAVPVLGQPSGWQTSIAKVSVDPKLNRIPGTAFVVAIEGQTAFLVTCAHVVENESSPQVEFNAAAFRSFPAAVRAREPGDNPRGLALLVVSGVPPGLQALPLAASANPAPGERVVVAGFPRPRGQFLAPETTIAGYEGQDLTLSRETVPGFSGGPVLRGDSVIGIVYGNEAGYGTALVSDSVRTYLRGLKVPLDRAVTVSQSTSSVTPVDTQSQKPGSTKVVRGLTYVWIPPGSFQMGCSPGDAECGVDEKPAHPVKITKGFWMGQTEVTVGAYKRYSQATGKPMPQEPKLSDQALNPGWRNEEQPIVMANWHEATAYCAWAGMRLPTEAEWEYAARADSREARYGNLDDIGWYADNSGRKRIDSVRTWKGDLQDYEKQLMANGNGPKLVGQQLPNAWKLYNMLGNVFEWTADWYMEKYYQAKDEVDPSGPPGGEMRVLRGGSWFDVPKYLRVSFRAKYGPEERRIGLGFRCAGD